MQDTSIDPLDDQRTWLPGPFGPTKIPTTWVLQDGVPVPRAVPVNPGPLPPPGANASDCRI